MQDFSREEFVNRNFRNIEPEPTALGMLANIIGTPFEFLALFVGILAINVHLQGCDADVLSFQTPGFGRIHEIRYQRCSAELKCKYWLHPFQMYAPSARKSRLRAITAKMSRGGNKGGNNRDDDSETSFDDGDSDNVGITGRGIKFGGAFGVFDVKEEMNQLDQRLMAAIEADSNDSNALLGSLDIDNGIWSEDFDDDGEFRPKSSRKVVIPLLEFMSFHFVSSLPRPSFDLCHCVYFQPGLRPICFLNSQDYVHLTALQTTQRADIVGNGARACCAGRVGLPQAEGTEGGR